METVGIFGIALYSKFVFLMGVMSDLFLKLRQKSRLRIGLSFFICGLNVGVGAEAAINPLFHEGLLFDGSIAPLDGVCLMYPEGGDGLFDWFAGLQNTTLGAVLPAEFRHLQCARTPQCLPAQAPLQRYVVYDWGSSSVRLLVADMDPAAPEKGVFEHFRATIPLPPHYEEVDLPGRLAAWVAIKWGVEAFFPGDDLQHRAIATAGLRASALGERLRVAVDALGVPVRILSQPEEGALALRGLVYRYPKLILDKTLAWDIGGKSMQWTAKEGTGLTVLGSDGGLFHFIEMSQVVTEGHPIDTLCIFEKAYACAHAFFASGYAALERKGFEGEELEALRNFVAQRKVYGVGPIHHLFAHHYVQTILGIQTARYTQDQLRRTILKLVEMPEEQVLALRLPRVLLNKKDHLLLGLTLLLAGMEILAIDKVIPVAIDNREGLLAEIGQVGNF